MTMATPSPAQSDMFGTLEITVPVSKCSIAQAMSALVKSVRLRHTESAVYWYLHVATCFPNDSLRLYRRLFIIGAEDCIDPTIQRQMYEWYMQALTSKNTPRTHRLAVYMIQRICTTEDWWQSKSGQRYILGWRLTEKASKEAGPLSEDQKAYFKSPECSDDIVEIATSSQPMGSRVQKALDLHFHGCASGMNRKLYASKLVGAARASKNLQARLTAQAHLTFATQLGNMDENWLGQALWRLLGEPLEAQSIADMSDTDKLFDLKLQEVFDAQRTPPAWTQDGIHCSGKDRRFAGLLPSMTACCNVFNENIALSPDMSFQDKHYSSDTLKQHHADIFQN